MPTTPRIEIIDGKAVAITRAGKPCKTCIGTGQLCHKHDDLGQRIEARHDSQCKSCQHPAIETIEAAWLVGNLSDSGASQLIGCSARSWQRHAHYKDLYAKVIEDGNLRSILGKMAQRAAQSKKVTPAEGVRAIAEAQKIAHGGERVQVKITLEDFSEISRQLDEHERNGTWPAELLVDGGR